LLGKPIVLHAMHSKTLNNRTAEICFNLFTRWDQRLWFNGTGLTGKFEGMLYRT